MSKNLNDLARNNMDAVASKDVIYNKPNNLNPILKVEIKGINNKARIEAQNNLDMVYSKECSFFNTCFSNTRKIPQNNALANA